MSIALMQFKRMRDVLIKPFKNIDRTGQTKCRDGITDDDLVRNSGSQSKGVV